MTPEAAYGGSGGHSTRNVNSSPDDTQLYVSIGSQANIAEEPMPRATIQEFTLDAAGLKASNQRTYASGLRNAVGTAFYPGTRDLYTVVNERDTLGDELVPDYLTKVADNGFYGWPYSYLGKNPQAGYADKRPDPRGYQVAFVPFTNKRPAGDYVVFASGFWSGQGNSAEVWGRPAGVAVAKDGSLLIADDGANTIWRVSTKK